MIALVLAACAPDRALLAVPVRFEPSVPTTIRLDRGAVTFADLRLEVPATEIAWGSWVSAAHAHPGHDFAGDVAGELLGRFEVDLRGEAVELGEARLYEGVYATARLRLVEVSLEGEAAGRPFRLHLPVDEEVTGIRFETTVDADAPPRGLSIAMDLDHAWSFVDASTPDADGDGVLTELDGSLANVARFGVTSTPTWAVHTEEGR